jgi:eukaryotic-like serine/threonine-protein kinase
LGQEAQPRRAAGGADPYAGRCLGGRYDVLFRLGAGRDAVVYAARDRDADRKVALKLLPGRDAASAASPQVRLHEARRLGSGDDRHVCEVIDVGVADDGTPFLVLDLLAGRSAARALTEDGSFEPAWAVEVAWQAASALAAAHALGVVHGAVDPSRVWLVGSAGAEGVKVFDFGAARAAGAGGAAAPAPGYAAPEVLLGREPDGRADVYAIGVLLYELLAGAHPFAGLRGDDLVDAALHVDPAPVERVRPGVGPALAAIVSKAMARDPVQRFASMAQLAAALGDLRTRAASPDASAVAPAPPAPSRRWGRVVAAGIALAALGGGGAFLQRARRAEAVVEGTAAEAAGPSGTPTATATATATPTPTSTSSTSTSTPTPTPTPTATATPAPTPRATAPSPSHAQARASRAAPVRIAAVAAPAVPAAQEPRPAAAPRPERPATTPLGDEAPAQPAAVAPALLQALVQERRSAVDGCIAEDPSVGGRMLLAVRVRADGTLAAVTRRSGGSSVVQRCIAKVMRAGRIPAPGRDAVGAVAIELDRP